MKGQFKLITQLPKPKELGLCVLSISKDGDAHAFENNGNGPVLAEMHRTRIDFAAANGIMISGMEPNGTDRRGAMKYNFQRWWMVYI